MYTIHKPSFWSPTREIRDRSNAIVGTYQLAGYWGTDVEAESYGRKLRFGYRGWDNRYAQMTDASGAPLATLEPVGWWGTHYGLKSGGKTYRWTMNWWGSAFKMYDGDIEIMRVTVGGYFTPGRIEMQRTMEGKELVPLVLFGIYYHNSLSANAAATGVIAPTAATTNS